ncbi:serine threonine kinase [Fusarium sp. NRRL 25303]|nr:serine threonine kinase [Fusarium sp. NRRL 25303]
MHAVSLIVLLQSIRLCVARPVDLQSSVLTTNADEILTPQDVVSGFEDWFKPKPTVKAKNTKDSICGDDSQKRDQCADKPNPSLDMGEVSDCGTLDQKINGSVSNDTEGNEESNGKPKSGSNQELSHKSNDTKIPLEWHDIRCFGPHQFGKHKDIYPISQQNYAGFACPETESKMIKKGDNSTFISYQRWIYGAPYLYNVHWKDGCELKNGKTEQDVTDPLEEGYKPEARVCQESLTKAYRGCDNGGTGGSLQAGCLVYEFQARDKDKKHAPLPYMRGGEILFDWPTLQDYYPMGIGQVIHETYQVVAKLGYGTSSTVWLSRDLSLHLDHAGRQHVREVRDTFKLSGPYGEHEVFVMLPLGISLRALQELQQDNVFQQSLVTSALDQTLLGLNYLHDADVIHTARKFVDETVIHVSQYMLGGAGALTICDLGQARIGKVHRGNAMPLPYRAPEVILGMTWGNSVDVWSVGLLAWDLLHKNGVFRVYDKSRELNDAHHLAAMTALLGPPPDVFLRRSDKTRKYWGAEGKWHGPVPLPEGGLKSLETNLSGIDRDQFLDFLAGTLTWLPEDRLNSAEAYFHLCRNAEELVIFSADWDTQSPDTISTQQGPASTDVGQQSPSNNQKALNVVGESVLQLEVVLSQLRKAQAAAVQAEKEREDYKASVKSLEEELKVLKEESDRKHKRIEELEKALDYHERRVWPDNRYSWLNLISTCENAVSTFAFESSIV